VPPASPLLSLMQRLTDDVEKGLAIIGEQ
jgi:hypothetical protein